MARQEVFEPRADEFARARIAVHARHHVVALGEITRRVDALDLLFGGEMDGDGRVHLETPDRLVALFDEGAITFLAAAERLPGFLALRDVHRHAAHSDRAPLCVPE